MRRTRTDVAVDSGFWIIMAAVNTFVLVVVVKEGAFLVLPIPVVGIGIGLYNLRRSARLRPDPPGTTAPQAEPDRRRARQDRDARKP